MIFCKESAVQQIDHLLHIYDELNIEKILDTEIVLGGQILVNRTALDYQLYKKYQIRIIIPLNSDILPYVIDIGNQIEKGYPHRYPDGQKQMRQFVFASLQVLIWKFGCGILLNLTISHMSITTDMVYFHLENVRMV